MQLANLANIAVYVVTRIVLVPPSGQASGEFQFREGVMTSKARLRSSVTATGSFVSLPEAFEGADDAVILAPKVEL